MIAARIGIANALELFLISIINDTITNSGQYTGVFSNQRYLK